MSSSSPVPTVTDVNAASWVSPQIKHCQLASAKTQPDAGLTVRNLVKFRTNGTSNSTERGDWYHRVYIEHLQWSCIRVPIS
jgi:hypothetical protein